MQPLPPAGLPSEPFAPGPLSSGRASAPPSVPTARDRVELTTAAPQHLLMTPTPNLRKSAPNPLDSPRPWPRPQTDLPRATALLDLASRGQAAAGPLFPGTLGAVLLPALQEQAPPSPGPWDATATPDGWRVPRNPSRTPVRPREAFEVQEGTEDLGPLRVVSSTAGRIRALRLQWPEEFQEPAFSAQKAVFLDLLTRLAPDVTMHVVAEGLACTALGELLAQWSFPEPGRVHVHSLHLHSTPDQLYCPMTMWARDGAILMRTEGGTEVLLLPRSFRGDGQVDASLNRVVVQGTGAAPARLAQVLPDLIVRRSALSFEGGDVVASRRAVLVGANSVAQNMADLRLSREAVVERFTQQLGRPVIVIQPQPDFHIDLGFTFLDDDTIAVADPGLAMRLVADLPDADLAHMVQVTREKQLAEKYDRAARMLGELGYRVVRLPNLCGLGLTTPYFTYNNVLMENYVEEGCAIKKVYMPVYGVSVLDETARNLYRQHGYGVIDMPSARLSTKLWGAIRCATGELGVTD